MSDTDKMLVHDEDAAFLPSSSSSYGRVAKMAGLLAGVVATAAATTKLTMHMSMPSAGDVSSIEGLDGMMVVKPPYEECAQLKDDCLPTACCAPTGYNCFKVQSGKGKCMRACTPGGANGTCEGTAPHMRPIAEHPGLSFYCFAVYTENTGSKKPNLELVLLQQQYARRAGMFSCPEWGVFSDIKTAIGGDDMTWQVHDVKGDFHLMKRKDVDEGSWVNTGMFVQVWKAVQEQGKYKNHNWVIKVDGDAVFFPHRLIRVLKDVTVPAEGLYLENCKYVDWGYFGNLEVFSQKAFQTLLDNVDTCYTTIDWKVGVKGGKYGPMGEDLFAQKCMDAFKVGRQENFGLTTDGACEADRPEGQKKNKKWIPECAGVTTPTMHPFKTPTKFWKCWESSVGGDDV